eukprot:427090-Rhodomonas_salina.1
MMRRQKPTQARLIFRSAEEALQFIAAVPPSARLKGSIPKFGIDTKAPKGSNFKECFASVPVSAKEVSEIATSVATAVLWDKKSDVEVAAFAEVAEDDCCKKSKPASAFETTTAWAEPSKGLVESAVLVADGRGMAKAGTRSKQLAKQAGKKNTRNTKSVTAICVAHMPTTFAVDMLHSDGNVTTQRVLKQASVCGEGAVDFPPQQPTRGSLTHRNGAIFTEEQHPKPRRERTDSGHPEGERLAVHEAGASQESGERVESAGKKEVNGESECEQGVIQWVASERAVVNSEQ